MCVVCVSSLLLSVCWPKLLTALRLRWPVAHLPQSETGARGGYKGEREREGTSRTHREQKETSRHRQTHRLKDTTEEDRQTNTTEQEKGIGGN